MDRQTAQDLEQAILYLEALLQRVLEIKALVQDQKTVPEHLEIDPAELEAREAAVVRVVKRARELDEVSREWLSPFWSATKAVCGPSDAIGFWGTLARNVNRNLAVLRSVRDQADILEASKRLAAEASSLAEESCWKLDVPNSPTLPPPFYAYMNVVRAAAEIFQCLAENDLQGAEGKLKATGRLMEHARGIDAGCGADIP